MQYFKKLGLRILVIIIVMGFIELTMDTGENTPLPNPRIIFYYATAFLFFMITWEVNDFLIKREIKSQKINQLDFRNGLRIFMVNYAIVLPLFALVYYLAIFHFGQALEILPADKWLQFRVDFIRASALAFGVISFNLFYNAAKIKKQLELSLSQMDKEIMTSKYNSLKSQISPHFLFNSLNVLTQLMYEDKDLASDFTARLAATYRYILDHKEESLASLEKELSILDSFIFMMNVRHEGSVHITTHISIDSKAFKIPTLSLQMLVENALKHNFYSKDIPLEIQIFSVGNDSLVIRNNINERETIEPSTKIGIENIKKRFSFYTEKEVIVANENNFFSVTIPILPITVSSNHSKKLI